MTTARLEQLYKKKKEHQDSIDWHKATIRKINIQIRRIKKPYLTEDELQKE